MKKATGAPPRRACVFITTYAITFGLLLGGCTASHEKKPGTQLGPSFSLTDTFITGGPILGTSYQKICEQFGQPEAIDSYDVTRPADGDTSIILAIARYKDIEFEFLVNSEQKISEENVFRYDITGPAYAFKGLTVGMPSDAVSTVFDGQFHSFSADVIRLTITEIEKAYPDAEKCNECTSIKKLLSDLKPDGYYDSYDQAIFVGGAVLDDERSCYPKGMTTALGAVILIKNNDIARIVFGYPTAG